MSAARKPNDRYIRENIIMERQKKKPKEKISFRKKLALANIFALSAIILILGGYLLFAPHSAYSEIEQRPLKSFPVFTVDRLLKGDFTTELVEYFSDSVPMRDAFKNIAGRITALRGIAGRDDIVIIDPGTAEKTPENTFTIDDADSIVIPPVRTPRPTQTPASDPTPGTDTPSVSTPTETAAPASPTQTPTEEPTATPIPTPESTPTQAETPAPSSQTAAPTQTPAPTGSTNSDISLFGDQGLVMVGARIMELFGGRKDIAARYALNMEAYKKSWGDSVNVYSMVIPVASGFYCPESVSTSREEMIGIIDIVETLAGGGVINVNVFNTLDAHKSEYTYLRTDHHWSMLGAYYAWCELAAAAGLEAYGLDSGAYTAAKKENYLGSLYGYSGSHPLLRDNPDTFYYYKPNNKYTVTDTFSNGGTRTYTNLFHEDFTSSYYGMLLGSDDLITEVLTDVENGRIALLVKDSFGKALLPYMATVFEKIYVVDPRYFEGDLIQFAADKGATDVIFATCAFQVSTSYPVGNTYVDRLEKLRS